MQQLQTINNNLPFIRRRKPLDRLGIRTEIFKWEADIAATPGAVFGDNDLFPVKHSFTDKIYTREMFIPKTDLLTGKIWKEEFPYFLLKGKLIIVDEFNGKKEIEAPCSLISKPGAKRLIYAVEDSVLTTVHHNPDNLKDHDKCLDRMTCENYPEYEKYIANGEKKLLQNMETENCGVAALKKITSFKNVSAKTLIQMAEENGLMLYAYKVPVNELHLVSFPAIFHSKNHFTFISKPEDIDSTLNYTGNVLLTQKSGYPKIKSSELKEITGATGIWTAVITGAVAIGSAVASAQAKKDAMRPQCEKDCKTDCKAKHKALFGGRRKCIKACRGNCVNADPTPSPAPAGINWYYVAAGVIGVIAVLIFIFRKKLFKS